MIDMYNRYFMYSQTQKDLIQEVEGPNAKFGHVIVNGVSKVFTEILTDPKKSRYSDARILISGDIRKISYIEGGT